MPVFLKVLSNLKGLKTMVFNFAQYSGEAEGLSIKSWNQLLVLLTVLVTVLSEQGKYNIIITCIFLCDSET